MVEWAASPIVLFWADITDRRPGHCNAIFGV
jgi:hypothetical protein